MASRVARASSLSMSNHRIFCQFTAHQIGSLSLSVSPFQYCANLVCPIGWQFYGRFQRFITTQNARRSLLLASVCGQQRERDNKNATTRHLQISVAGSSGHNSLPYVTCPGTDLSISMLTKVAVNLLVLGIGKRTESRRKGKPKVTARICNARPPTQTHRQRSTWGKGNDQLYWWTVNWRIQVGIFIRIHTLECLHWCTLLS